MSGLHVEIEYNTMIMSPQQFAVYCWADPSHKACVECFGLVVKIESTVS